MATTSNNQTTPISYIPCEHVGESAVNRSAEQSPAGRQRGPVGIAKAWIAVLTHPRAFFKQAVAPGDQAPGLAFAVIIAFSYVGGILVTRPARILGPDRIPVLANSPLLTMVLLLLATAIVVAPAVLHLVAALQTGLLIGVVSDRAGVSETVQIIGYATAPAAIAWVPLPLVTLLCGFYGAGLLIIGLSVVHRTTLLRATVAGILPAVLIFGGAYGGITAGEAVVATLIG